MLFVLHRSRDRLTLVDAPVLPPLVLIAGVALVYAMKAELLPQTLQVESFVLLLILLAWVIARLRVNIIAAMAGRRVLRLSGLRLYRQASELEIDFRRISDVSVKPPDARRWLRAPAILLHSAGREFVLSASLSRHYEGLRAARIVGQLNSFIQDNRAVA